MAEEAADKDCEMIKVGGIKNMWKIPPCLATSKLVLKSLRLHHKLATVKRVNETRSLTINVLYQLSQSQLLMLGIFGVDATLVVITEIFVMLDVNFKGCVSTEKGLQNANLVMMAFLSLYFIFRVLMFYSTYPKTVWYFINLICLIHGYVDVFFTWFTFGEFSHELKFDVKKEQELAGKVITSLRFLRVFQILELGVNVLLNLIKRYIRDRLTTGCDMGRGFVRANELAIRLIDHLSDDANVQHMIRASAEKAKMSVLRELGLLQGLHPDIALGVKTCQAIRSVLNVMRDAMHHLMEEGGIDEAEGLLFIKVIESKMKRLMAAPPTLEIPSTKKILSAIPWIDGDQSMVEFINNLAEERLYNYGDIILRFGDQPDGIYFIISGLVKVEAFLKTESGVASNNMQTLDFLSTGNVIGEISVLTQKPRTATLTCETSVKTLYLSTADLKEVCEQFRDSTPPLLGRLWKVCAVRISINILANVASYHGMRKETLLARLENAELEHVDEVTNQFEITPQMIDVILIMGEAYDVQTREKFVGPCYIPKTVFSLLFTPSQTPRPLMFYSLKLTAANLGASRSGTHKNSVAYNKTTTSQKGSLLAMKTNSSPDQDKGAANQDQGQGYERLQNLDF